MLSDKVNWDEIGKRKLNFPDFSITILLLHWKNKDSGNIITDSKQRLCDIYDISCYNIFLNASWNYSSKKK